MVAPIIDQSNIRTVLRESIDIARANEGGAPASYIPELANADLQAVSAAITMMDGQQITAGDFATHTLTLQSSAKLILLAGLLEDLGEEAVFAVVGKEPSGVGFASAARLETHGPYPANPLVNAGAIALCGQVRGNLEDRLGWLEGWTARLCGHTLRVNQRVLASERRTGDRNRALAYLLRAGGILTGTVDETLELYFSLCSFESRVDLVSRLGAVLASEGLAPNDAQERILSRRTASIVVALMATCGMYDESGAYLVETGLPAKSGVSGVIVAVAPGRAGIAAASARINAKGGSVRGHVILRHLASRLGWHFSSPGRGISSSCRT